MRILVTGGAGFIGSHLIDTLLANGHDVICLDSFFSGRKENIEHHLENDRFTLVIHDIVTPLPGKKIGAVDQIYHLACPASPVQYQFDPIHTMQTAVNGTHHVLQYARRYGARVVYTSTSEAYGDPLEHPQKETYWGNVDPIGKRACYDEGKRAGEALCKDFAEQYKLDVRIVRIFNTYGPRMMFSDGRVLSNFILQALLSEPITLHGDGSQTRSFCYVSDLVNGLCKRMDAQKADYTPMNLGNPDERSILQAAKDVLTHTQSQSEIVHVAYEKIPERMGDPKKRCPDITKATKDLVWSPSVSFADGLQKTIEDFQKRIKTPPRVIVFTPSYYPQEGPAERSVRALVQRMPGWGFDIVTTGKTNEADNSHDGRIVVHRVGNIQGMGKLLFPFQAAIKAKQLRKKSRYTFAWAVMASYGALAAIMYSWLCAKRTPFLLSVFEDTIDQRMQQRGVWMSFVYQFIFRRAHRWQVVGRMNDKQRSWYEHERQVQAVPLDNIELLAKKTKEQFQELEILSSRI